MCYIMLLLTYRKPFDYLLNFKYFMKAVAYCLKNYGVYGKGIYFPDKSAWEDAVNDSGYLKSVECIGM